jgi:hypothetical protein
MESTLFSSLVPFALLVAIIVTAYEMRKSLEPASCPECPHCKALAAERERRDRELQAWYARSNHIETDEDDDRRIG